MKQRIISLLLVGAVLFAGITISGASALEEAVPEYNGNKAKIVSYSSEAEYLASMLLACEDEKAALYFDKDTANIALVNKQDSSVWFSSPLAKEEFSSVSAAVQKQLASAVLISFTDSQLQKYTLGSFADSAAYGQMKYEKTENGVDFTMTLGKLAASDVLPQVIPASRTEKLESVMDADTYKYVIKSYRLIELKGNSDDKTLISDYPCLADGESVYVLRSNTNESVKNKLAEYFSKADYTREDLEDDEITVYGEVKSESTDTPCFTLKLIYALENGQLKVNVPIGDISYDEDKYTLIDLEVLRYFGADGFSENGYFFLPDGSGTVSEYKAGEKGSGSPLTIELYGTDAAYQFDPTLEFSKNGLVPIYGQSSGDSAYIAMVESGDAQSAVRSVIDESENNLRYTHFICHARLSAKYVYSESASHNEYLKSTADGYSGDYTVRYIPISGHTYSDMANTYREYLMQNGILKDKASPNQQFHVELLGAVEAKKNGIISDTGIYALTTFEDSAEIIDELSDIGEFTVSLNGWANGGIDHTVFNKARPVSQLGGKKGLKALAETANSLGVRLYPTVNISYAIRNRWFDGFSPSANAAHQLDNSYARIFPYNLGSSLADYDKLHYAVKSISMLNYNKKLLKDYKYETAGLTYVGIGETVNSDTAKNAGSRTDALDDYIEILKAASDNYDIELTCGNQYVWKYASAIRELPSSSSLYRNTSYSVPFVQMLLHGYLPYSSEALNFAYDYEYAVLKAIENGEQISYVLAYRNLDKLTDSEHTEYNSVDYSYWKEKISENVKRLDSILSGTYDKAMVEHKYLSDNVVAVSYDGGITVIVNYSYNDYIYEGVTVKARDAVAVKG